MASTKSAQRNEWREGLEVWSTPIFANMLWLLLAIPVITMPIAFVGLFAVIFHWTDNRRTQVFAIFFGTIRRVWVKCYLLFALDIAVVAFLMFNLLMFQVMDMGSVIAFLSRSATLFSLIIFIVCNVMAWVMVAVYDAPLKTILKFSLQLVFAEPIWALGITIGFILPFVISLALPTAVLVMITGTISAICACKGTHYLVKKHIPNNYELIDLT